MTTETLLNEMEATGGAGAWSQKPLRIEHGDGIMPDQIPRVKALGIIVVANPINFTLGELMRQRFGDEKAAWSCSYFVPCCWPGYLWQLPPTLRRRAPVANPYLHIMYANAYPGKPRESLTREEALIAFTRTAAYAEFAESSKGTLEPGKCADLAVLS